VGWKKGGRGGLVELIQGFGERGEVWDAELVGMEKDRRRKKNARARVNMKYENKFTNIDRRGGAL